MNHLCGSFLLPQPALHSWDQQDVTSVQTLGKPGAWQASPSPNLSLPLLPTSLNLGTCQVHWEDTCARCLWHSSFPWWWKGKENGPGWKEVVAPSATGVPLGAFQGIRSWGCGSCCHQRVWFYPRSQREQSWPSAAELIQRTLLFVEKLPGTSLQPGAVL